MDAFILTLHSFKTAANYELWVIICCMWREGTGGFIAVILFCEKQYWKLALWSVSGWLQTWWHQPIFLSLSPSLLLSLSLFSSLSIYSSQTVSSHLSVCVLSPFSLSLSLLPSFPTSFAVSRPSQITICLSFMKGPLWFILEILKTSVPTFHRSRIIVRSMTW